MSIDYEGIAASTAEALAAAGRPLPIRRPGNIINKVTGASTSTPVNGTITALVLADSKAEDNTTEGGTALHKKRRLITAAAFGAPFEPQAGDEIDEGADTWVVLGCTPVSPAGVPLVYKIKVVQK